MTRVSEDAVSIPPTTHVTSPETPAEPHKASPGELAHRAKDEARDAGYEHAGLFLLIIDHEDAVQIIRALDTEEVIEICKVIASHDTVSERDARRVTEEYGVPLSNVSTKQTGGPATVRHLITTALSADVATQLLGRIQSSLS